MGSCSAGSVSQVDGAFPPARVTTAVSAVTLPHPSPAIGEYRGEDRDIAAVGDPRQPAKWRNFAETPRGICSTLP
jgi:hypothetical protein